MLKLIVVIMTIGSLFPPLFSEPPVYRFYNGKILRNGAIRIEDLWISEGKIISPQTEATAHIDLQGLLVAPGYIDIQVNGGFGIDFSSHPELVQEVAINLPRYGVTSFLPTIVTVKKESYPSIISHLQPRNQGSKESSILGIHLEGPFFNILQHGAHNPDFIHYIPTKGKVEDVYGPLDGVKIVTLAPELPNALKAIDHLQKHGIIVSAGHTEATYDEMEEGIQAGLKLSTHLFNAMTPFHHRKPGVAGAVLTDRKLYYSIIADGIHLHPATIDIAWRSHPNGLILVTDSMAALGLPPGTYHLGSMEVTVDEDKAYIAGTKIIAGSVLSMDHAVRFFRSSTNCSLVEALEAASTKPALLLGIEKTKGTLNIGSDADFIFLDDDLYIQACYIRGVKVFEP